MKRILLLCAALFSAGLYAQNFRAEVPDTTLYGQHTQATFYGDIDIFNDKGSTFAMAWELVEEVIPDGWETSSCDPEDCREIGVTGANFTLPVLPSFMNTHFYPNDVPGTGYKIVKLWVIDNPADSVILTYYGVAGVVGINELKASDIQVYPSPAKENLNVLLPNTREAITATIYKISGQEAGSFTLGPGEFHTISVENLATGVYAIQFSLSNGGVLTKKFIKE